MVTTTPYPIMEAAPCSCAVLLAVLQGDEGTALFRESVMSLMAIRQVEKIFMADLGEEPRDLAALMPAVDDGKAVALGLPRERQDALALVGQLHDLWGFERV